MIELSYQLTSTNNGTFQKIESTVSEDAEEDPETGMENLGNFAATWNNLPRLEFQWAVEMEETYADANSEIRAAYPPCSIFKQRGRPEGSQ